MLAWSNIEIPELDKALKKYGFRRQKDKGLYEKQDYYIEYQRTVSFNQWDLIQINFKPRKKWKLSWTKKWRSYYITDIYIDMTGEFYGSNAPGNNPQMPDWGTKHSKIEYKNSDKDEIYQKVCSIARKVRG